MVINTIMHEVLRPGKKKFFGEFTKLSQSETPISVRFRTIFTPVIYKLGNLALSPNKDFHRTFDCAVSSHFFFRLSFTNFAICFRVFDFWLTPQISTVSLLPCASDKYSTKLR